MADMTLQRILLLLRWKDIDLVNDVQTVAMTSRYAHPGATERRSAVSLLGDGHHMDTMKENVVDFIAINSRRINMLGG